MITNIKYQNNTMDGIKANLQEYIGKFSENLPRYVESMRNLQLDDVSMYVSDNVGTITAASIGAITFGYVANSIATVSRYAGWIGIGLVGITYVVDITNNV